MTLAAVQPAPPLPAPVVDLDRGRLLTQQHFTMGGASWSLYEQLLADSGERSIRITYLNGDLEMMAPLAEHESGKEIIGVLIDVLALERNIPMARFGSTTFRREDRRVGLEPDKCYYLQNASKVRGMKRFDPSRDPPPDLAIEVDITARSVAREPVYAALGVPELWRYDGNRLTVHFLDVPSSQYKASPTSQAFPFLPMDRFEGFIHRMDREEQTAVLREFQGWVRTLK